MIKYSLNGSWQMKNIKDAEWLAAVVPGSVLATLFEHHKIEDPYYRENEYIAREFCREDYEFVRYFDVEEALLNQQNIELVCYGLDTLAEVYINNQFVQYTDNMHRTWRIPCKTYLKSKDNEIRIIFKSPINYIENYEVEEGKEIHFITSGAMKDNQYIRKAHSMFGWDWGIQLPDAGIWRSIELQGYSKVKLEEVITSQDHQEGHVSLKVLTRLGCYEDGQYELRYTLIGPDGERVQHINTTCITEDTCTFNIEQPKLWWPNGYGSQPLYKLEVALHSEEELLEEQSYTIGLRTLTISEEKDQWGKEFAFIVNGVKIFTKGANYIPEDAIYPWITEEKIKYLLESSVKAHFNCIRIWGGGYYPSDAFYELCNMYGLIVWQDLMFACNIYEVNEAFAHNIVEEAKDNVKRLRHHPCLGLWCGNNEIESAWDHWGGFKDHSNKLRADYIKQFEYLLPKAVKEEDAKTFYWPSSPSSGGCFEDPDSPDVGDNHYWDVWHGQKPFSDYQKYFFRFCSQFGFQSFPSVKTIDSFTREEDRNILSKVMESHQKNDAANGKILYYLSETFKYPKDFESLIYISQILQGVAIKSGVEHWRRHRGRCMGTLYWQLNDNWPVASWSSIDYYGRWKALHYMARNFYAPLAGSVLRTPDTDVVSMHWQNETLEEHRCEVCVTLRNMALENLHQVVKEEWISPLSAKKVLEIDFTQLVQGREDSVFLEVVFKDDMGREVVEVETFVPYKHLRLPEATLKYQVEDIGSAYEIKLEADGFMPFVFLDLKNTDVLWEDNYFHMTSLGEKTILLDKKDIIRGEIGNKEELCNEIIVRYLRDAY